MAEKTRLWCPYRSWMELMKLGGGIGESSPLLGMNNHSEEVAVVVEADSFGY